jgi:eukaryotic-like serine/threonine-protein kinase
MSGVAASLPIAPGALLHNKYEPIQRIGGGNSGEVWLAKDHAVDHTYAIKILKRGITVVNQLREAKIGHAFTHNNLVRVHQADVLTDGRVIIAMDFLPSGPITTLANPANFLPLPVAIRTIVDILQGLEHLHACSFFHNDIKPENILRGQQGQAKLADYGIVGISQNGKPVPAPARYILHAAPETSTGNCIEARTDIFQTGLTLFRLLCGLGSLRAKFNASGKVNFEAAMAAGKLISDADFPPFVPRAVIRVVKKSIDPAPSRRYQSALEMRRALEKLSFPGHWTVELTGAFIGLDEKYRFRFESILSAGNKSSLKAFKRHIHSGRETRVSAFTKKNIAPFEARKLEIEFIGAVVAGQVG